MAPVLAYDVYGTLLDLHGLEPVLARLGVADAQTFAATWRSKQLEYSFRRGLMDKYVPFDVITKQALDFACKRHHQPLTNEDEAQLMQAYKSMPAFPDAREGLSAVKREGWRTYAFTNGRRDAAETVLKNAGLFDLFDSIVSADEVMTFKPAHQVYAHFLTATGSEPSATWLVTSNTFDAVGAVSCGLKCAWVQRDPDDVYDGWGDDVAPTEVVNNLSDVVRAVKKHL